ncbi:MAG: pilus assembly protein TadG-related protein, partial [Oceanococcaceae bacterium]
MADGPATLYRGFRPPQRRQFFGARRQQDGAVAIFVAIALVAIIAAIGFALDLGRMYVAKAELQKLATVAALSTVRQVSGCSTGVNEPISEDDLGSFVNSQFLLNGLLEEQIESLTTAIFPGVQTADGVRSVLDTNIDSGMADSVGVSISRPLPPALFPLSPRPEGALLRAEAHAAQTVVGRVSVSPQLLAVNTDESALLSGLLGGLLGTAVNLTVADFNSLIDADVTLLDIVRTNPVVASVDDFLNLETSLSGALDLVGNALFDTGEAVEIAAANLLGGLAADAAPPRSSVRIGDFIGVEEGFEDQVGNLPINAFDLLMGLSQLANVGYQVAFAVPNLVGLNIPGVASLNI